jgi:hypothetical protein
MLMRHTQIEPRVDGNHMVSYKVMVLFGRHVLTLKKLQDKKMTNEDYVQLENIGGTH